MISASRSLRRLAVAGLFGASIGSAVAQTPIAPPTAPEAEIRARHATPARAEDLPGAWVGTATGETLRFDSGGAFDGSALGAGTYAMQGSLLTLSYRGQPICSFTASVVSYRQAPALQLTVSGGRDTRRCASDLFTRQEQMDPPPGPSSTGGRSFLNRLGFGSSSAEARPEDQDRGAADPGPGEGAAPGAAKLTVQKVVSRPSGGKLSGIVVFGFSDPSGTYRIEVPYRGAKAKAEAIAMARGSLRGAVARLNATMSR